MEDCEENMIHYDPTERGFGEYFVYVKMPLISAVQNSDQEFIDMLIDSTKCYTQKYLSETRKVTTAGLAIDKRWAFELRWR